MTEALPVSSSSRDINCQPDECDAKFQNWGVAIVYKKHVRTRWKMEWGGPGGGEIYYYINQPRFSGFWNSVGVRQADSQVVGYTY